MNHVEKVMLPLPVSYFILYENDKMIILSFQSTIIFILVYSERPCTFIFFQ
jgi:hypothetical protein